MTNGIANRYEYTYSNEIYSRKKNYYQMCS